MALMKRTGKKDGENQDNPKVSSSRSFYRRDAQQSNFRGRVESKTKQYAQRIHFPGTIWWLVQWTADIVKAKELTG